MVKMQYDQNSADMIIMRDADMKVVQLNAMDTSQNYEARVYWNKNTKESYIDVLALPAVPSNKQFQLWALVDGKPFDAGVFELGEMGMQKVKDIDRADAWAVTLEPKGGSAVPTLTEMYLMGKSS
jgi:anti-sigma-K factor RskA